MNDLNVTGQEQQRDRLLEYLRWNSYRSQAHHLHYVATPKAACTSLKWWFARLEGCEQAIRDCADSVESDPELAIHDTFHRVAPQVAGLPRTELEALLASDAYYRFALVRNPYRRIFSAWQTKLLLREPLQVAPYLGCDFYRRTIETAADIAAAFEGFLEHLAANEAPRYLDVHWTPQASLLRPDLVAYSRIAKFEAPTELAAELAARLGPRAPAPFVGRRANESLIAFDPAFVTERAAQLIRQLYAEDFETFGYPNALPPAGNARANEGIEIAVRAIALIRARHLRLEQTRTVLNEQIHRLKQEAAIRANKALGQPATGLAEQLAQSQSRIAELTARVAALTAEVNSANARLRDMLASNSWRITVPLRSVRRWFSGGAIEPGAPPEALPPGVGEATGSPGPDRREPERSRFVPLLDAAPLNEKPARVVCFYLPQFHAIPENDAWWGKGFTEWTKVRGARPLFSGHRQPREPGDLGYYNLLDPAVQRRQVQLARLYGIEAFCFYTYWFHGKRLLEAPLLNYLNDRSLDLPFCLCWANENWSRRWDGLDHEILIGQAHTPEDDLAFIGHVARYLREARYLRIGGRPLLLVYRPDLLPSAAKTAERWRAWCRHNGIGEIYLAYTQSFEMADPADYGMDAAIEFPPNVPRNGTLPPVINHSVEWLDPDFRGTVYDWRAMVGRSEPYGQPGYRLFRGVCPDWDNTPRRDSRGTVFLNSTPELYGRWLRNAIRDTQRRFTNEDERLIFVNGWNEWAEGAYLEPDSYYGYAFLQATREALIGATQESK